MLGHADDTLTMQLYTHLTQEHRASASGKLEAYIAKKAEEKREEKA